MNGTIKTKDLVKLFRVKKKKEHLSNHVFNEKFRREGIQEQSESRDSGEREWLKADVVKVIRGWNTKAFPKDLIMEIIPILSSTDKEEIRKQIILLEKARAKIDQKLNELKKQIEPDVVRDTLGEGMSTALRRMFPDEKMFEQNLQP